MHDHTVAGQMSIATPENDLSLLVVEFYHQQIPAAKRFRPVPLRDWSEQVPEWWLLHGWDEDWRPISPIT